MQFDRIEGKPDEKVAWGSDIAAQMLRRLGIPYISLNPGASYRGLHDSLVNHLGNERPGILLCLHEDHSVAIAHGYAKATGEPMACVLHSNVGLLHGMMSLFNAWCDRVPMIVLGATGPLDAEKRRPWIDWIHTSRDQGALDPLLHQVGRPADLGRRRWSNRCAAPISRPARAPTAPVYICLDAGLQEQRLDKEPEWPDLARFMPPAPSRPAQERGRRRRRRCWRVPSGRVIMFGRGARKPEFWQPRIRLAERLGACVVTDLKQRRDVSDRPSGALSCRRSTCSPKPARELLCEADVILALDWVDLGGALRQARTAGKRIGQDHRRDARPEPAHRRQHGIPGAAGRSTYRWRRTADAVVADLLDALGPVPQGAVEGHAPPAKPHARRRRTPSRWSTSPRRCARSSTIRRTSPSARSAAAGRSTSGRSRTAWPISARTAAAGSARARALGRRGARAARPRPLRHLDARRRRLLHGRDRDLDRGAPPHPAARSSSTTTAPTSTTNCTRTSVATHARARDEEPLDRTAHGRPRARHRQARRGAGRRRHRPGHQPRPT